MLFTFFFGSASLLAQVMMNGLLSFLVFVALWVIAEINFPFTGPVHVTPEPLHDLSSTITDLGASASPLQPQEADVVRACAVAGRQVGQDLADHAAELVAVTGTRRGHHDLRVLADAGRG